MIPLDNPDLKRLYELLDTLKQLNVIEYELKGTYDSKKHSELLHMSLPLKAKLSGYKYYEIECVEELIKEVIDFRIIDKAVKNGYANAKRRDNFSSKIGGKAENVKEMSILVVMLLAYLQQDLLFNTNNSMDKNVLIMLLIVYLTDNAEEIEEENLQFKGRDFKNGN